MALPSGYKRLKYIQSSGNQWLDTGVAGKTGLSVFCDFEIVSTDLSDIITSGSVTSDWSNRCYPIAIQSGYFAYGYTNWYNSSTKCSANTRYAVRTDLLSSGQKMTVNGTTVQSSASTKSLNNGYNVFLFGNNVAGSGRGYGSQRGYACQMYMDGSLVRDYIPCETNSGTAGMWDDENSVFYGNAGTGSFISGPVIDPMAPHDGHNTNIGNAAREIDAGTTLIGGVSRDIKSGTVLVSGVLREIEFGFEPSVFTVELKGTFNNYYAYVTINGEKYVSSMTIDVEEGTEIDVRVDYESTSYMSSITLNGDFVSRLNYTLTVTGNVVINSRVGNVTSWPYGAIDITME